MQMIWQNHDGVRLKRLLAMRGRIGAAQYINVIDKRRITPPRKIDRKEIRGTGNAKAAVYGHAAKFTCLG